MNSSEISPDLVVAAKPSTQEPEKAQPEVPSHPIASALDSFLHINEDVKSSVVFVKMAEEAKWAEFAKQVSQLKEANDLLKSKDDLPLAIKCFVRTASRMQRLTRSRQAEVMEISLFLGLFSAFDAFMGNLIGAIYLRKPQLYAYLSRTINVSEILQHKSFEELKATILREEIEDLRRKSYVDQFKDLENTFGIKLRGFAAWPHFIECAQRRNLFTHCDGEASEQYFSVCEREGYTFVDPPKVGTKLKLGTDYFLLACDLVAEVAVKLAQTLWRKVIPEEIGEADKELNAVIYNCLEAENYKMGQVYGIFGHEQKAVSSDLYRKMFLLNYAIALKFDKKSDEAFFLLRQVDWTSCSLDFKLAEAILNERLVEACGIMKKMGKNGEMIREESYHIWPLFKLFRVTQEFLQVYQEIYGHPFVSELQKAAADKTQFVPEVKEAGSDQKLISYPVQTANEQPQLLSGEPGNIKGESSNRE